MIPYDKTARQKGKWIPALARMTIGVAMTIIYYGFSLIAFSLYPVKYLEKKIEISGHILIYVRKMSF